MKYCRNCGNPVSETARFCPNCGTERKITASNVNSQADSVTHDKENNVKNNKVKNKDKTPDKKKPKAGRVISVILCLIILCGALCYTGWHFFIHEGDSNENESKPASESTSASDEKYFLTVAASTGGVAGTASGEYTKGEKVELTASAETGYVFVKWVRDDEEEIENAESMNTTLEMPDKDISVLAIFITEQQSEITEDDIFAYKVMNRLRIDYADGDYADSVTRKLTLCSEMVDGDMSADILWSSSDTGVVGIDGTVTRPDDNDETVKLTAHITVGEASADKEFTIKVIAATAFNYEEAPNYSILDIEELNDEDSPVDITYTDNMEYVESISGKFSEVTVNSTESAIQAICNVRGLLGIDNPSESLVWKATNYDDESLIYSFAQYWNNYRVYGFSVRIEADKESGETSYLSSSLIPDVILNYTNTSIGFTQEDFTAQYADVEFSEIEMVVYAVGDYAAAPVLAYYGRSENETVIVSAVDGTELKRYSNVYDWGDYTTTGNGKDESGKNHVFPVQFHQADWYFYYLEDIERGIEIKGDNAGAWTHEFNTEWDDPTAISAYINMMEVYDWYKDHLNRYSVDGNGMTIKVNVHAFGGKDNACWNGKTKQMYFYDNRTVNNGKAPTTASGLDIMAHELTHGVLHFILAGNGVDDFPYEDYTGAINEGYADVFGWFVDHDDTTMGEEWQTIRDLADPERYDAPVVYSDYRTYYLDNGKPYQSAMVHTNSSFVYHAAYLMEKDGIPTAELEKLWYKSLMLGYDASSDFVSVRRNLIQAGKRLGFNAEKMSIIRRAFDTEEIYDELGELQISFTDAAGAALNPEDIEGLAIVAEGQDKSFPDNTYSEYDIEDGTYCDFSDIYKGEYIVNITADGYLTFVGKAVVNANGVASLPVVLIKDGNAEPISGYITSATTGVGVPEVRIYVFEGWNMRTGAYAAQTITDGDGAYSLELPAGYYTLMLKKDDYTTGYFNVVSAEEYNGISQNGSISPIIGEVSNYRVVLSWGENPRDLDAHLKGYVGDSEKYHVYFGGSDGYYNNEIVANLDVDDTSSYGPETVTFEISSGMDYEYFVDWYSGSGTWALCGGRVEVYSGSNLLYVFNAPAQSDNSGCWLIFTIKNGIFRIENKIVDDMY